MSKFNGYMGLALMIAACANGQRLFMDRLPPEKPRRKPIEPMTPEREKIIMESIERNKHDYNIHGTIIRAKDRKTAIKIYNNQNNKK